MRRHFCFISFLAVLCLMLCLAPAAGALDLSRDEVRSLFASIDEPASFQLFDEEPSLTAPYACGVLSAEQKEGALSMLNAIRALAGLPAVTLDEEMCTLSQHAAVLCAIRGEISHAPEAVADMDDAFYQTGAAAAARCNLAQFNWNEPRLSARAMLRFVQDDTPGNLQSLGHRRWMLSPEMSRCGVGLALDEPGRTYLALYVTDSSADFEYESIAWPCAGAFPAELMNPETPWSISLNPACYDIALSSPCVTITEEISGETWTLTPGMLSEDSDLEGFSEGFNEEGAYFIVSEDRYAGGAACIFRPDLSASEALQNGYEQNQVWQVTLSGLCDASGAPCEDISYTCSMCSLTPIDPAGIELSVREAVLPVGGECTLTATVYPRWADDLSYTLSVSDPAVAEIDESGTLRALSAGSCTLTAAAVNGRTDEITVTVTK